MSVSDPWPLLRKRVSRQGQRTLRLIVHGRSGGVVPDCLVEVAEALSTIRSSPVQLDALTADSGLSSFCQASWLIPLFLLPGSHVRHDIPSIRRTLRDRGEAVTALPFLGAWPLWWDLVAKDLRDQPNPASVTLLHHPLRAGLANRFLGSLSQRLGCPLMTFDSWSERSFPEGSRPYPLALAPNRMTDALGWADDSPTLLERPSLRLGLIDLLTALP